MYQFFLLLSVSPKITLPLSLYEDIALSFWICIVTDFSVYFIPI